MRAEINHTWAVTGGNHPSTKPYYVPLTQAHHGAARAEFRRLTDPDAPPISGLGAVIASGARRIPAGEAVFWYQLIAIIETTWAPINNDTDLPGLAAQAITETISCQDPIPHGSHPGTTPADQAPHVNIETTQQWIATRTGQDPNTEDPMWSLLIPLTARASLAQAHQACREMIDELDQMPDRPRPHEPLTMWYSLRTTATTPWTPATTHIEPQALITAISHHLTNP